MKKKDKKILIIVFIIGVILVLGICAYFYIRKNNQILEKQAESKLLTNVKLENKTYEYGSIIKISDLKLNKNQEVYIDNKKYTDNEIKLDKLGTKKITIKETGTYKDTFKKTHKINSEKTYTLSVKDTTKPTITGNMDKTITVGDAINPLDGVKANDNVDGVLDVKLEGSFDTNTVGEYKIKYVAIDKSGNKAEAENTITVKEKEEEKSTSSGSSSKTNSGTRTGSNTRSSGRSTNSGRSNNTGSSNNSSNSARAQREAQARAEARRVVGQITNASMSQYEKAKAICKYLTENTYPQHDQGEEAYKKNFGNEAYAALILHKAACSGYCRAAMFMCEAAGLTCTHVNANSWTHQWNTVTINGRTYAFDTQIGSIEDENGNEVSCGNSNAVIRFGA